MKIQELAHNLYSVEEKDKTYYCGSDLTDIVSKLEKLYNDQLRVIASQRAMRQRELEQEERRNLSMEPINESDDCDTLALKLEYQLEETHNKRRRKYVKKRGGWLTEFHNRDYCSDNCKGWDGQSRRCQCGNRRIDWNDGVDYSAY